MLTVLKKIHRLLLKLAKVMGRINTVVLLFLSFYLLLLPISLLRRVFGRPQHRDGGWHRRDPLPEDHFRKQY
jgi:hypothetical protein